MKNKTSLVLIEMSIMIAVFALTAAVCLRAFVWSYTEALLDGAKTEAVFELQNTAELLKYHRGDLAELADILEGELKDGKLSLAFDKAWERASDSAEYFLTVAPIDDGIPLLASADITVTNRDGVLLAECTVSYREGEAQK